MTLLKKVCWSLIKTFKTRGIWKYIYSLHWGVKKRQRIQPIFTTEEAWFGNKSPTLLKWTIFTDIKQNLMEIKAQANDPLLFCIYLFMKRANTFQYINMRIWIMTMFRSWTTHQMNSNQATVQATSYLEMQGKKEHLWRGPIELMREAEKKWWGKVTENLKD